MIASTTSIDTGFVAAISFVTIEAISILTLGIILWKVYQSMLLNKEYKDKYFKSAEKLNLQFEDDNKIIQELKVENKRLMDKISTYDNTVVQAIQILHPEFGKRLSHERAHEWFEKNVKPAPSKTVEGYDPKTKRILLHQDLADDVTPTNKRHTSFEPGGGSFTEMEEVEPGVWQQVELSGIEKGRGGY